MDLIIVRENTEGEYVGLEHEVVPGVVESHQGNHRERLDAHRQIRLRVRPQAWPQEDPFHPQSQHHEALGRAVPALCAQSRRGISGDLLWRAHHRQHLHAAGDEPFQYDTLLLENLYGDIVSDLCAGLVGGLGLVPGANLGHECAIFEAVHGSAPDIAGKDVANPTALLQSAVLMLRHLDEMAAADKVQAALEAVYAERKTLTRDVGGRAGTTQFADAVLAAMG